MLDLAGGPAARRLGRPDAALADVRSKATLYGPLRAGTVSELSGKRLRIVGTFTLGTDFRNNGTLV